MTTHIDWGTTHRGLALCWLGLAALASVAGVLLALLARLELAQPGLGWFAPSTYNALVLGHGQLLWPFGFLPLAVPGLFHLILFPKPEQAPPPLLSRLALWGFAAGMLIWCAGFLSGLIVVPEGAGWVLVVPGEDSAWSFTRVVLNVGQAFALVSLAAAAVGLIWCVLRQPLRALALTPAGIGCLAACGSAMAVFLREAWSLLRMRAAATPDLAPAALPDLLQQSAVMALLLIAGLGLLHAAVQRGAGQALVVSPLAALLTGGVIISVLLARGNAELLVQLLPLISISLWALAAIWLVTLLIARPFAWPVAACLAGLVVFFGLTYLNSHEQAVTEHLQETYYVVAYGHLFAFVSFSFVVFAALYAGFPALSSGAPAVVMTALHLCLFSVGAVVTFVPQFFVGLQGMPRRYADYVEVFSYWNLVSSLGSVLTAIALLVFAVNAVWAVRRASLHADA